MTTEQNIFSRNIFPKINNGKLKNLTVPLLAIGVSPNFQFVSSPDFKIDFKSIVNPHRVYLGWGVGVPAMDKIDIRISNILITIV